MRDVKSYRLGRFKLTKTVASATEYNSKAQVNVVATESSDPHECKGLLR